MLKHHPVKGGAKSGLEQHTIYYPEDNVTETVELRKETWRHIVTTVLTSYRGTVIKASPEEGLQVHLDGGNVRESDAALVPGTLQSLARMSPTPSRRAHARVQAYVNSMSITIIHK